MSLPEHYAVTTLAEAEAVFTRIFVQPLSGSPFNMVIARRAARTSIHDLHSHNWCLEAILLCDRLEIGCGNVSTHVESPAPIRATERCNLPVVFATFPKRVFFGKVDNATSKQINAKTGCHKEESCLVFGKVAPRQPKTRQCFKRGITHT